MLKLFDSGSAGTGEAGSKVKVVDSEGGTCLHFAAHHGFLALVVRIAEQDPSLLRSRNAAGNTPLHVAVASGAGDVCRVLVEEFNVPVAVENIWGESPISLAVKGRRKDIQQFLEEHKNPFTLRMGKGDALHAALEDSRAVCRVEW